MQELLKTQDRPSSLQAGQEAVSSAPVSGAAETPTDDLVPISAWLGQASDPMDQRIAEEALLAGVDHGQDFMGSLDAGGALNASSGPLLAPGAAEGLASAPVQQQQYSGSAEGTNSSLYRGTQFSSGLPGQGDATSGATPAGSLPGSSSSQDSRPGRTESAVSRAGDGEGRQEAYQPSEARSSAEEDADESYSGALQGLQSTGLANGQEAYREDSPAETGRHCTLYSLCKPPSPLMYPETLDLGPSLLSKRLTSGAVQSHFSGGMPSSQAVGRYGITGCRTLPAPAVALHSFINTPVVRRCAKQPFSQSLPSQERVTHCAG